MEVAAFVDSLKYMGIGMVSIFVIISLIVILIGLSMKCFPPEKEEGGK
ncbi:MAG: hypothetical protein LBV33_09105 [Lachnospiraceae bacterium]|jgi:hypothetical protein|nr:hypothetical protein [Lachnospiraceae bacterium]